MKTKFLKGRTVVRERLLNISKGRARRMIRATAKRYNINPKEVEIDDNGLPDISTRDFDMFYSYKSKSLHKIWYC